MSFESVLFVVALIGALGFLVTQARQGRPWMVALTSVALLACGLGATKWTVSRQAKMESRGALESKIPKVVSDGGYVSSDQCQSCHADQYESWHRSYHRTMTQSASPETVLGDFNNVTLHVDGEAFHLEKRGTEYWVEMVDPDWKHDQAKARAGMAGYTVADPKSAPRVWKRIGMLTGSHNFQAYWVSGRDGNVQFAFQFAWLIPEKRWVPRKDTFIRDPALPSPVQSWNINCIQCHVTDGRPGVQATNKLVHSTVGELGIGCESCHGPGERHVTQNMDPLRRYLSHLATKRDDSIVQPKDLAAKAQTEVCGQCHGMKWTLDPQHWREAGPVFRPGGDLTKSAPLIRPADFASQPWLPEPLKNDHEFLAGAFWPDGMIRVTGREYNGLMESACHTKGNMTCLSCHSIHKSDPVDQIASGMDGNQACVKCHESIGAKLTAHTHHAEGSSGSLCYNCHMPHATYGLLKSVRNHFIDRPDVGISLKTGRPNACNLCHMDQTLEWSAKALNGWYGKPIPEGLGEGDRSVSATVNLLLKGDAAQRALMAAGAGWAPARAVSGESWISFYLCQLLDDPYSAVRLIAWRSLQRNPAFQGLTYDYVGAPAERTAARRQALERWATLPVDRAKSNILFSATGRPVSAAIQKVLTERDRKRVELIE